MMTFAEASKSFKKQYPERKITNAADLDAGRYVVVAQVNPSGGDFADPIFFINKRNGKAEQMKEVNVPEMKRIKEAFASRGIKA